MEALKASLREWLELIGLGLEALGVAAILAGTVLAFGRYPLEALRGAGDGDPFARLRRRLGRSILIGLELMIAGDIIRTVVVAPSLPALGALAIVVLLRILLAWTLFLETEGRWPWRSSAEGPRD